MRRTDLGATDMDWYRPTAELPYLRVSARGRRLYRRYNDRNGAGECLLGDWRRTVGECATKWQCPKCGARIAATLMDSFTPPLVCYFCTAQGCGVHFHLELPAPDFRQESEGTVAWHYSREVGSDASATDVPEEGAR